MATVIDGNTGVNKVQNGALTTANLPSQLSVNASAAAGSIAVDASGRVTMPYQPAFSARKDSVVSGPALVSSYDQVDFNVGSHFNASTGRFTAPIAGLYAFWYTGGNGGVMVMDLQRNGSRILRSESQDVNFKWQGTAMAVLLNANDYVDIFVNNGNAILGSLSQGGFGGYLIR
jgi:hypothetical protein